jgi:hypothetical protein
MNLVLVMVKEYDPSSLVVAVAVAVDAVVVGT